MENNARQNQPPWHLPARYASTPDHWAAVARACRASGICGLDTETFGYDIESAGPVSRARIHVWSLAVFQRDDGRPRRGGDAHSGVLRNARGNAVAAGVVLPACALVDPAIVSLLADPGVTKVAHNAPHDVHALRNEGISVEGWVDSLPRARVLLPTSPGHGLKRLCTLVGRTLREYEDVVTMDVDVPFAARRCICGAERCQRRSKGHERQDVTVYRRLPRPQPLESIVPGHPLWPGLLEYAAEDAVTALELWDYMDQLRPFTAPDPGWGPDWGAGPAPPRNA